MERLRSRLKRRLIHFQIIIITLALVCGVLGSGEEPNSLRDNYASVLQKFSEFYKIEIRSEALTSPGTRRNIPELPGSPEESLAYPNPKKSRKGTNPWNENETKREKGPNLTGSEISASSNRESGRSNSGRTSAPKVRSYFLDPIDRPYVSFVVSQENPIFSFELKKDLDYFISVVVEKMVCGNGAHTAIISIERDSNYFQKSLPCLNVDYRTVKFNGVEGDHITDGDKWIKVQASGNWTASTAHLVASIYDEVAYCSECDTRGDFCCGRREDSCTSIPLSSRSGSSSRSYFSYSLTLPRTELARCIPKHKLGDSLVCDGHPNCGFRCNKDENECSNDDNGNPCRLYTCREDSPDRFFITILILILFCIFIPFVIFIFFCSRKDLRREFLTSGGRGRSGCPTPFEILFCPFSINADSSVPSEDIRPRQRAVPSNSQGVPQRGNERRGGGVRPGPDEFHPRSRMPVLQPQFHLQGVTGLDNFSYFDDPPPSYAECCNDKSKYPNPPKDLSAQVDPPPARSQSQQRGNPVEFIVLAELERRQRRPDSSTQTPQSSVPTHWCQCAGGGERIRTSPQLEEENNT